MDNTPSMWKASAIGGLSFGVLAGIPVVNYLNCACCALIIGGGFLAAYLYSRACQDAGVAFGPGNGALAGLAAAPFYAIGSSILSAFVLAVTGSSWKASLDQVVEQAERSGADPGAVEAIVGFFEKTGPFLMFLFLFGLALLLALVFSTIGGLIGGAAFKVAPPPPAPPTGGIVPPPPPSPGGVPPVG